MTLLIDHTARSSIDSPVALSTNGMVGKLYNTKGKEIADFDEKYHSENRVKGINGDIIAVGDILSAAGVDLKALSGAPGARPDENQRSAGVVVSFLINYQNRESGFKDLNNVALKYKYYPTAGIIPETKHAVNFANTEYKVQQSVFNQNGTVSVLDRHGIYIVFAQSGQIGQFSFIALLSNLVASIALLKVASLIVDFLMTMVLPEKDLYKEAKTQITEEISKTRASREDPPEIREGYTGLYTIPKLLKIPNVRIDVLDKLPVPYGLIRYGIAPDHPDAKNVIHKFEKVLEDPRVTFIGNVDLGKDVQLSELFNHYHRVVLAYGASEDRKLGVPGEETVKGVVGAQAVVNWYNGMFGCHDCPIDLEGSDTAIVIGQGNVALDVARMLVSHVDLLRKTETPIPVIEALSRSRIQRVHIVGRRGPQNISMTAKELREMIHLPHTHLITNFSQIDQSLSAFDAAHVSAPSTLDRSKKRVLEMLSKYGSAKPPVAEGSRSWHLDFWHSPIGFNGGENGALRSIEFRMKEGSSEVYKEMECGVA
ncbi:NADPH-adrenodoxin reductase, partial [Dinochytrium kinnereticum]